MISLPLTFTNGRHFHLGDTYLEKTKEELENFLQDKEHLKTKHFATNVMFSHEIKANNQIEGYTDDLILVEDIIKRRFINTNNKEQVKRILNLYHGYNYILNKKEINKETLRELYSILSKDLLDSYEKENMGKYYRNEKVYILVRGIISKAPCEGIDSLLIDEFMNKYFDFLNNYHFDSTDTDEYIKSQILHLYFVYIHPYFDVNGRTSRTLSMWYLLNKKVYSYIIFNRGIVFKGSKYDQKILEAIENADMTKFILFMLDTVKEELEKEYIMESISENTSYKLSSIDYQTLLYLLSMHGIITVKDFAFMYNRFNDKKKIKEIYKTMIDPLITKNILKVMGQTSKYMFDNLPNEILEINPNVMTYDKKEIRRLTKYN